VKFYYRHSPAIADYIAKKEGLKAAVRVILKPFVLVARHSIQKDSAAGAR
jgi:hypothetical protein